jgi:hypothetical protein
MLRNYREDSEDNGYWNLLTNLDQQQTQITPAERELSSTQQIFLFLFFLMGRPQICVALAVCVLLVRSSVDPARA